MYMLWKTNHGVTGVPAGMEAFKPKHIEIIYTDKNILK